MDAALGSGLLFPGAGTDISSLMSPAAISGSISPNVSEPCPPGLALSAGLLISFNDGLEPVPTRLGGLGQSSLSHLCGSIAPCL